MTWWMCALLSAVFAALTAILGKVGIKDVPSNLGTAIRTLFVLACAWGMAFIAGEQRAIGTISRRSLLFLGLSGLATGLSWLAYYRALQLAPASKVAPLDKLSLPITILFAILVLKEPLSWKLATGVAMIVGGILLTLN